MNNNKFNSVFGAVILIFQSVIPILMGGFAALVGLSVGLFGPGFLFVAVGLMFVLTGVQRLLHSIAAVRELLHPDSDTLRAKMQIPFSNADELRSDRNSAGAAEPFTEEPASESVGSDRATSFSYCPYCGAPTNGKDLFCRFCGRRFPTE